MHILHIAGARLNFPKLAPVHRAACVAGWQQTIVHTGQHYDAALSDQFFQELSIPQPDETWRSARPRMPCRPHASWSVSSRFLAAPRLGARLR